jgi:uncharacterized protein YraI
MSPSLLPRPGRSAALTGAVLAIGATAAMALAAGSAAADVPGRCTADVNVRSAPDPDAAVVGLCAAGTRVQVAEARNGFVHLPELDGWAAARYVAVDGTAPAGSTPAPAQEPAPTPTVEQDDPWNLPDAEVNLLF